MRHTQLALTVDNLWLFDGVRDLDEIASEWRDMTASWRPSCQPSTTTATGWLTLGNCKESDTRNLTHVDAVTRQVNTVIPRE
jgi:hypothetical protein